MAKMQYYGTGRRKSSVARVRLIPGKGNIIINKKTLDEYFGGLELLKNEVRRPLQLVGAEGKFDVVATVKGGGTTGQSGALRHGVSRALCHADEENRAALKAAGFLTRDPRKEEVRPQEGKKGFPVQQALIRRKFSGSFASVSLKQSKNPGTPIVSGFLHALTCVFRNDIRKRYYDII